MPLVALLTIEREGDKSPATCFFCIWGGFSVLHVPHLGQWLLEGVTRRRKAWQASGSAEELPVADGGSPGKARGARGARLVKLWDLKGETIFKDSCFACG